MNPDRTLLSDQQWEKIKNLLPGKLSDPGVTAKNNRCFIEAVCWVLRTGAPWRDLPEKYGNPNAIYRRFRRWVIKGVWKRLFEALKEDPDFEWIMIDSSIVRAHQHAAGAKKGDFDEYEDHALGRSRGGFSSKIHVIVDALGYPVDFDLTGGQKADCTQAESLIEDKEFENLLGDKGFDTDKIVEKVEAKGANVVIPSKSNRKVLREYDKEIYKERNKVERFFNRIKQFRRIATRYEKTGVSYMAMLFIASVYIWIT
jgi:transposase